MSILTGYHLDQCHHCTLARAAGANRRVGPRPREGGPLDDSREPAPEAQDSGGADGTLVAAILRIGASLDPDTVLREPVDGARALTGARHGATYAPTDRFGQLPRLRPLRPHGARTRNAGRVARRAPARRTPARPRCAAKTAGPGGIRPLARMLPTPVPCRAFPGTPMRHRDTPVGRFFLGAKEGGVTDRDETVLMLSAQQAADAERPWGALRMWPASGVAVAPPDRCTRRGNDGGAPGQPRRRSPVPLTPVCSGDYRVDTFPDQRPCNTFGSDSDACLARPRLCRREVGKRRPTSPMSGGGTCIPGKFTRIRRSSEVIAGRLSSLHRAYRIPARGVAIRSGPEENRDLRTPAPARDIAAALTGSQSRAREIGRLYSVPRAGSTATDGR